uniref:Fic family protein n=2 Tax=Flavobacterium sp. TaxID=239 RepID=UPI00404B9149
MLTNSLIAFNAALLKFQVKFPKETWSQEFRNSLINDYSFFSARVEDSKLKYGETIRFLNNETVRGLNLSSLLGVSEHQSVLKNLLDNLENFELSEKILKDIHADLMGNPLVWETEFKNDLVGNYRNVPTVGAREPLFNNKEYAAHYNLDIIMATFIDMMNSRLNDIDNNIVEKHLLTRIAYFHNKFLNDIHPFADGNGRVCRISIGALLMINNCPPIFPEITSQEQQIEYISTIVQCEIEQKNDFLVTYLANRMTEYLLKRIDN